MSSVDKLFKLADRFARKISLGQQFFLQPSELQNILQKAGLWDKSNEVAPLLNQAGVGESASVSISISVDSKLNVSFPVITNPPAAAAKLSALLKNKYGAGVKAAIQAAKGQISDAEPLTVNWLTF